MEVELGGRVLTTEFTKQWWLVFIVFVHIIIEFCCAALYCTLPKLISWVGVINLLRLFKNCNVRI